MKCSNVKNIEYKNIKTQSAQCAHSLNKMSTNNTKCSMCSFIEHDKQKIAQCAHSLNTINNENFFLLYKFSKHSLFKRCVQFALYFLNIVINIYCFLIIIIFYFWEFYSYIKSFSLNLKALQIFFYIKLNQLLKMILSQITILTRSC